MGGDCRCQASALPAVKRTTPFDALQIPQAGQISTRVFDEAAMNKRDASAAGFCSGVIATGLCVLAFGALAASDAGFAFKLCLIADERTGVILFMGVVFDAGVT
jgi:serine protease inhibitor